jgi:hypothetical protein
MTSLVLNINTDASDPSGQVNFTVHFLGGTPDYVARCKVTNASVRCSLRFAP